MSGFPLHTAIASYYNPAAGGINGSYGAGAWAGHPITPTTNGFAHRTMPFGTQVEFHYQGRSTVSTCVDRGPFIPGRTFDLLPVPADALGMHGVAPIQWRIVGGTVKYGEPKIGLGLLGNLPSPLSDIGGAAYSAGSGAVSVATAIPSFLGKLSIIFSGNFWLRVLMGLGGVFLIGLGLFLTGKEMTLGAATKAVARSPKTLWNMAGDF